MGENSRFYKSQQLPPVILDFLAENNIFSSTGFFFEEINPSVYDLMSKTSHYTSVSYFKIEVAGRLGHVIIENQDGDLKVIRNSIIEFSP